MRRLPTVADLAPAERQKLAALARAEIAQPCGGYDVVSLDGAHPLSHLTREPESVFLGELSRRAITELRAPSGKYGGSAATRRQLAKLFGLAEDAMPMPNNYSRRNAYDQDPAMPARGRNFPNDPNDPNGEEGMLDAETAQRRIQQVFDQLDEAEQANMIAMLAAFVEEHAGETDAMDQVPQNNLGVMDRGRGRRPAQDRRLAMDIARQTRASNAFNARWGNLVGDIEVWSGVEPERWRR